MRVCSLYLCVHLNWEGELEILFRGDTVGKRGSGIVSTMVKLAGKSRGRNASELSQQECTCRNQAHVSFLSLFDLKVNVERTLSLTRYMTGQYIVQHSIKR